MMISKKQGLCCLMGMALMLGVSTSSYALMYAVSDLTKAMQYITESIQRTSEKSTQKQKNDTLVAELGIMRNEREPEKDPTTGEPVGELTPTTEGYTVLADNFLSGEVDSSVVQSQTSLETAKGVVRDTFYDQTGTSDGENAVAAVRQKYLQESAEALLAMSATVRENAEQDIESAATAAPSGGGILQDIDFNSANLVAMSKAMAQNIALQIQMAEVEIARDLVNQRLNYISGP